MVERLCNLLARRLEHMLTQYGIIYTPSIEATSDRCERSPVINYTWNWVSASSRPQETHVV
jgi:hypothetical protein